MKIEKRVVDESRKIVQITCQDERWYDIDGVYVPSVTWICDYYPKGIGFYKWLANHGWDEAEGLKEEAGDKGSRVHLALEDLVKGNTVKMEDKYQDKDGKMVDFNADEWEAVCSFNDFWKEYKPEPIKAEFVVVDPDKRYAGTVDLLCKIKDEVWMIDYKTSSNVYPSHEIQLSAYKHACGGQIDKMAVLQVGYRRNKKKFKINEIEDKFELFESAYKIWDNENKEKEPKQKDFPLEIKL